MLVRSAFSISTALDLNSVTRMTSYPMRIWNSAMVSSFLTDEIIKTKFGEES